MSHHCEGTSWWQSLEGSQLQLLDQHVSSDAGWSQIARTGYEDWQQARTTAAIPTGSELSVLEIGCGAGRMTSALSQDFGAVVGCDVCPDYIDMARSNVTDLHVRFELLDGERLNRFVTAPVDVVFSYEVFHYLELSTIQRYLFDAFDVLTPGGTLAIQLNTETFAPRTRLSLAVRRVLSQFGVETFRGWPTHSGFVRRVHRPDELIALLQTLGFNDVQCIAPNSRRTWFVAQRPTVGTES